VLLHTVLLNLTFPHSRSHSPNDIPPPEPHLPIIQRDIILLVVVAFGQKELIWRIGVGPVREKQEVPRRRFSFLSLFGLFSELYEGRK